MLQPLSLIKSFLNDPAPPGGTVNLQFVATNMSATDSVTDIAFTDDLDAALSGLAAVGLPTNDVCGAGSQISGTGLLSLIDGVLAPGESCFFTVTLDIPGGVASPTTATNVTSEITGTIGGLVVSGDPATDSLLVEEAICEAIDGESMTFENDTLDEALSFELCEVAVLGPDFTIIGPNGSLTLQLGIGAILDNGTSVLDGGRLAIGIDESLKP